MDNQSSTSYDMIRMLGAHFQSTPRAASAESPHYGNHANAPTSLAAAVAAAAANLNGAFGNGTTIGPQCPHCGKTYSNASNLRQHVRNVHVPIDKSLWHTCTTCGKKLKTKHYLINHQLQAHGIHQRGSGIGGPLSDDMDTDDQNQTI